MKEHSLTPSPLASIAVMMPEQPYDNSSAIKQPSKTPKPNPPAKQYT